MEQVLAADEDLSNLPPPLSQSRPQQAPPSAAAEQADSDAADQAREAREAGIMDGAAS